MLAGTKERVLVDRRVRAILLTPGGAVLFIKRVKPFNGAPYWVAPGGGVEPDDLDLFAALERELYEELGAVATVLETAFVLEHRKAGKELEEHFFVCLLQNYDLSKRDGPEFADPARGEYLPDEVPLTAAALNRIDIKTPEMRDWMIANLGTLRRCLQDNR